MSTINKKEIEKFSKIADEWWDTEGKFKPLHKFNPIRIKYLKENIIEHFYGVEDIQEDEEGSGRYWRFDCLVSIRDRVDIDDDKIKIMKDYGVAYEHNI